MQIGKLFFLLNYFHFRADMVMYNISQEFQ